MKSEAKMVVPIAGKTQPLLGLCNFCKNGLSSISYFIVSKLESGFYNYGSIVGRNPLIFILICLGLTGISCVGLINFVSDHSERQFMSDKSLFKEIVDWQKQNFMYETHFQTILFEAKNVLDKDALLEMLHIRNELLNMTVGDITWGNICAKRLIQMPCVAGLPSGFNNYCELQESRGRVCSEDSILELWNYDENLLRIRSQEEIIEDINRYDEIRSRIAGLLGSKTKMNATEGKLKVAKAVKHSWYTDSSKDQRENSFKWEESFIAKAKKISANTENVKIYIYTSSSFGKVVSQDIAGNLSYLISGFLLVFLYVMVMLGKFNLVEQRPVLSLLGLSCVGLSIAVSYGLSSAFGIPFGAMNSILPFLLLGLGVDDMFVIISAWNNIPEKCRNNELSDRIGMAMQRAGVSITVTSITNFLAFIIGSSSDLPGLRYFCLYAAIGIAAIYFFQATFFVACLSIDQRRLEDNRQGLVWCWKLRNWKPNRCSQTDLCKTFFTNIYAKYLFLSPFQIIVLLLTSVLFFVSCWGASNLKQEFDAKWFLPPDSYLARFFKKSNFHYPSTGYYGQIIFNNISHLEMAKTTELVTKMRESDCIDRVGSWYQKFSDYFIEENGNMSLSNLTDVEFFGNLSNFLYSCKGTPYRLNFRFVGPINCTVDLPEIVASTITYYQKKVKTTKEKMEAIKKLFSIVKSLKFDGLAFPFTQAYITWETNYVIGTELLQNILLALLMVFLVTLFLLTSLPASFLVMLCVLATLVDVAALMHWWGLTIDTISAIDLVLAIGLSVDYAAHVAHTYLTVAGNREERARATVGLIGPAVLNGGFTTFLSFLPLAGSDSYVFITFFKIFFAVSLYGVYHGLVFLPVILSLLGPAPYVTAQPVTPLTPPGHEKRALPAVTSTVGPLPPLQKPISTPLNPEISSSTPQENEDLLAHPHSVQSPLQNDKHESSFPTNEPESNSLQTIQQKPIHSNIQPESSSLQTVKQEPIYSNVLPESSSLQTSRQRPYSNVQLESNSLQTDKQRPFYSDIQPESFSSPANQGPCARKGCCCLRRC